MIFIWAKGLHLQSKQKYEFSLLLYIIVLTFFNDLVVARKKKVFFGYTDSRFTFEFLIKSPASINFRWNFKSNWDCEKKTKMHKGSVDLSTFQYNSFCGYSQTIQRVRTFLLQHMKIFILRGGKISQSNFLTFHLILNSWIHVLKYFFHETVWT